MIPTQFDLDLTQPLPRLAIDECDPMEATQPLDKEVKALRRMEARVQRVEQLTDGE